MSTANAHLAFGRPNRNVGYILFGVRLPKGLRLGPYEILAPAGSGGMGEVYRARDTRLGRTVAIKVIATRMSMDPGFRLRLQREARAIANLNHPNICVLFDIGEATDQSASDSIAHREGPFQYLVMEYLDGETLSARLKRGQLPVEQAVRYAIEIGDALDRAHRKRILHRDLKPSNIMITKNGARLLDFGLAKSMSSAFSEQTVPHPSPGRAASPRESSEVTTAEKSITADGVLVGTLEYMSPEQLRGKEPDARSEIFSFAACVYEMVTGHRPFHAKSRADLLDSILEHQPAPMWTYQSAASQSLDWLVQTCLSKDPDDRMQTMHDVLLELKRIAAADTRIARPPASRARKSLFVTALAAMILVLVGIAALRLKLEKKRTSATAGRRRFSISLPGNAPLAIGTFEKFAVSPDGTSVVYSGGAERAQLYLYSLDSHQLRPLPGTAGARGPFFAPNGEWIGFYTADRELKKVSVSTGALITLSRGRDLRGATWGSDGTIVFAEARAQLQKMSEAGGQSEVLPLENPLENVRWPSFFPDSDYILYTASDFSGDYENARLAVRSLKTGKSKVVLSGATYGRYMATGHLAYLHSQTVFAVPFDVQTMTVRGNPVPIIPDVDSYFGWGLAHFSVSRDGTIFYIPRDATEADAELVWVDRSGKLSSITTAKRDYEEPRLSPDGKQLLVSIGPRPRSDLWSYDFAHRTWTRLTSEGTNTSGIWSPDGTQIAFASNRNGKFSLFAMPSDGAGPAKFIAGRRSWDFPTSWSPDGKAVAVVEQYRTTAEDIFIVPIQQQHLEPKPFVATLFSERSAAFSPTGGWIAYQSNESGRFEIYIRRYPGPSRKWLVSTDGGINPVWRRDGNELFYTNGAKMMAVKVKYEPTFFTQTPQVLFSGQFDPDYDVAADGSRFVMVKRARPSSRTQINVILGVFGTGITTGRQQDTR